MNSDRPVEFPDKIQYLKEKIDAYHWECHRSDDFMFRLKFQEYIDSSIDSILQLKTLNPNHQLSPNKKTQFSGFLYRSESKQLQRDNKIATQQNLQMSNRQKNLQIDNLKIRLENKELEMEMILRSREEVSSNIQRQFHQHEQKHKFHQKQIQKLVKLNQAQHQEMKKLREERNRAEQNELEMREKYDKQVGYIQRFNQKKPKFLDRSSEGLKCTKIFTNLSKQKTGNQKKFIIFKLPITLQVNKIVYGILLGVQNGKGEVNYYERFQLYEKQTAEIENENDYLHIRYRKRRSSNHIVLDKYKIRENQVVVMLFGKGDSIFIYE